MEVKITKNVDWRKVPCIKLKNEYLYKVEPIKKRNTMKSLLFLQNLGAGEIIIIALVVLLLFGGKKIPELMRGIGKGVRSFKEGINDVEKEIGSVEDDVNKIGKDEKK